METEVRKASREGETYFPRFHVYFQREVAQEAADPLSPSAEIEFHIENSEGKVLESFSFNRKGGVNNLLPQKAEDPQIIFVMTPRAAEEILSDPAQDVGTIGVNIIKLILSSDANRRVAIKLKSGFMTLFTKGYFGVLTKGGSAVFSYMASKGFGGMSAIKNAVKKMRQ